MNILPNDFEMDEFGVVKQYLGQEWVLRPSGVLKSFNAMSIVAENNNSNYELILVKVYKHANGEIKHEPVCADSINVFRE